MKLNTFFFARAFKKYVFQNEPYDGWSDCSDEENSRWAVELMPGQHPRAWATDRGFPVDVIEDVAVNFMSEPRIKKFATPMMRGESVRKCASRVGYPPTEVDKIVEHWDHRMPAEVMARM